MAEVRVAFPGDEASAELMASRLRAAGIAARVDRGLYAAWQVGQRGQITVLVDEGHAKRAREILGTESDRAYGSVALLRAAIVGVIAAIAVGVVLIFTLLAR